MNGDKLPRFVIGKSKKPRYFKTDKNYFVVTEVRVKPGWVQRFSKIGSESLTINLKKNKKTRKVILIVDNGTPHPDIGGLKVKDFFSKCGFGDIY